MSPYCRSPFSPCNPCTPFYPLPVCDDPEYCEDVFADKCIVHKGNYLPNIDISEGARLDTILTAIDTKFSTTAGLTANSTLNFPLTTTGVSSELTISVPGASDGDIVQLGFQNVSFHTGTIYTARVSATDTVSVAFNNFSGGSITPTGGIFKVIVIK